MVSVQYCSGCAEKGEKRKLSSFQINFEDAVLLCSNAECTYLPPEGFSLVKTHELNNKSQQKVKHQKTLPSHKDVKITNCEPNLNTNLNANKELDEILNELANVNVKKSLDLDDLKFLGLDNEQPNSLDDLKILGLDKVDNEQQPNALDECFKYPLWKNENNLCWLHSTMCLIVHNNSIRNFVFGQMQSSFLNKLILGFDECVALLNSEGTHPELISETLKKLRNELFNLLKPRMKCKLGECDNPWFVLHNLMFVEKELESLFDYRHHWETNCRSCGFKRIEKKRKCLQTLTNVDPRFSLPKNVSTIVSCIKCSKPGQKRFLKLEDLPTILALQFTNGLPKNDVKNYDFVTNDAAYKVSAIIQYRQNPNHFVTWIRDLNTGKYLCCDDLKTIATSFKDIDMKVKNSELHILIWEKTNPCLNDSNKIKADTNVTSLKICEPLKNSYSNPKKSSWMSRTVPSFDACENSSSSFSDHSDSTASFLESCATSSNSVRSINTNQTSKSSPNYNNYKSYNTKKFKSGTTSTVSEISNASDGDFSIVSVSKNSKASAFMGYCPKTNLSPPKLKKKKRASPKKDSKKKSGGKVLKDSVVKDSINNILNDTDFFLNGC